MSSRIVVAWDGSLASRAALQWALERVERGVRRLVIVHAVDERRSGRGLGDADGAVRAAVHTASSGLPDVEIDVEVRRGDVVDVVASAVDAASLLVVGHDPASGARLRPRATSLRLVEATAGPVVLTPAVSVRTSSDVVVGVDDRGGSVAALRFAALEARDAHATLRAVTAWSAGLRMGGGGSAEQRVAAQRAMALQRLEEHVETALMELPDVGVYRRLVEGPVARRLVDAGEGAALVVVGAGSSGSGRLGRVTRDVILSATAPTAVVR